MVGVEGSFDGALEIEGDRVSKREKILLLVEANTVLARDGPTHLHARAEEFVEKIRPSRFVRLIDRQMNIAVTHVTAPHEKGLVLRREGVGALEKAGNSRTGNDDVDDVVSPGRLRDPEGSFASLDQLRRGVRRHHVRLGQRLGDL